MTRPLEGIRVLDLTRLLPGPFLTLVLADLGADVIKVEDPNLGDYLRAVPPLVHGIGGRFLAVNRDKRSLALDIKANAGRETFLRLVDQADIVVEGFRPGVMDRLGLGWAVLSARNPRIILGSISGYGQDGPYRDRAGHDLNYISLAGVLGMTGAKGGPPQMPGVQIADIAGGGLWGAVGILAALVGRGVHGKGSHIDISMTEGALTLLMAELGNLAAGAGAPTRGTETLNGGLASYNVYATKDGKYLSVAPLEPKFYAAFNEAIGRPVNMGDIVAPPEVQECISAEIQRILGEKTRDEWLAIFQARDVCCEPVLELCELPTHPLHVARRMFFTIEHPSLGSIPQVRTPVGEPRAQRVAPQFGEHSASVLAEFAFSRAEIESLIGDRTVVERSENRS